MKTLLACIALFLCLHPTIRAAELSLNGGPAASSVVSSGPEVAASPVNERIHLGLDRHEENEARLCELPSMPSVSAVPALPTANVAPSTVAATQEWMSSGSMKTLTLDPPKSAPVVGTIAAALPPGATADSGVPDSAVYAGLGVLLMALAWVCAGGRHRHSERLAPERAQDEPRRVRRVRMVALNVSR